MAAENLNDGVGIRELEVVSRRKPAVGELMAVFRANPGFTVLERKWTTYLQNSQTFIDWTAGVDEADVKPFDIDYVLRQEQALVEKYGSKLSSDLIDSNFIRENSPIACWLMDLNSDPEKKDELHQGFETSLAVDGFQLKRDENGRVIWKKTKNPDGAILFRKPPEHCKKGAPIGYEIFDNQDDLMTGASGGGLVDGPITFSDAEDVAPEVSRNGNGHTADTGDSGEVAVSNDEGKQNSGDSADADENQEGGDELEGEVDPFVVMMVACAEGNVEVVEACVQQIQSYSEAHESDAIAESEQKPGLVVRAEDFWGEKLPDRENYIRRMELMVQHTGIAMEVRKGKEGKEDRIVFSGKDPHGDNVGVHVVESKFRQVIENAGEANQEVSLEELVAGVKERMTFDINGKEVDMLVIPNGRFNMANERTKFKVNGRDIFRTTGDLIDMMSKQARNWGTEADWGSLMINLNGENIQIKPENRRFILDLHIDNLLSDLGFSRFESTQFSSLEWIHQETGITVPGDISAKELATFLTTIRIDQDNGETLMARFEASE